SEKPKRVTPRDEGVRRRGPSGAHAARPTTQYRKDLQNNSDRNLRARFNRLEQGRKCNCKDQKKKIRPARLPNRQQISRDEQNDDEKRRCFALARALTLPLP